MISTQYPALRHFFGAYFHQDFDLLFNDEEGAINAFLNLEPPESIAASLAELNQILAAKPREEDVDMLLQQLGVAYDPTAAGRTNLDWIRHVKERLARHED